MISPSTPDDLPVKGLGSRTLSIEELIEQGERQMRDSQSKISSAKKVANAGNFSSKKTAALPPKTPTVQQKRQQQQQLVSPKSQSQQHSNAQADFTQPPQSWGNDGVQDDQTVALVKLYASADTTRQAKDANETHASELLEFEAIERELLASSPDGIDDNEEWSEQHCSTAARVTEELNHAAYDAATAAVDDHAYSDDADLEELSHAEGLLDADKYPWHGASHNANATDYDDCDYEHSSTVKRDDTNNEHSTEQQEDEAELLSANSYHHFTEGHDAEHSSIADIAGERARACAEESTQFDDSHAWNDETATGVDDDYYNDRQHEHQQCAVQATADLLPASVGVNKASLMSNEHTATDTEAVPSSQRYAAVITLNITRSPPVLKLRVLYCLVCITVSS
jgi:hypothetical protein